MRVLTELTVPTFRSTSAIALGRAQDAALARILTKRVAQGAMDWRADQAFE